MTGYQNGVNGARAALVRDDERAIELVDVVGPVLRACDLSSAIVDVIQGAYPDAEVIERGAYVRVLVPPPCVLSAAAVEERTGAPFRLPVDLERVMVSFRGRLRIEDGRAVWEAMDG